MAPSVPAIQCEGLSRQFGNIHAVRDASLELEADSMGLVVGPSAAGKTTLLRLIAGLEKPDSGRLDLFGQSVVSSSVFVPPEKRRVGYLSQNPSLWPHLSICNNVTAHVPRAGLARQERKDRAASLLEGLGIGHLKDRKPHQLSEGEYRRCALARALAPQPKVMLFDEPFSNLDPELRHELTFHISTYLKENRIPSLWVSHLPEDPVDSGARIFVMQEGRITFSGTLEELRSNISDRFTARLCGYRTFLPALPGEHGSVSTSLGDVELESSRPIPREVGFRPEALIISDVDSGSASPPSGRVKSSFWEQGSLYYRVRLDGKEEEITAVAPAQNGKLEPESSVTIHVVGKPIGLC